MNVMNSVSVKLKSENGHIIDMDDHLCLGVFGKGYGKEFPLDLHSSNEFESGADAKCRLEGDRSDSEKPNIDLDKVDHVYLRKNLYSDGNDYDDWKLNEAEVTLYGSDRPQKRIFHKVSDFWFALEHGLKVWLEEE